MNLRTIIGYTLPPVFRKQTWSDLLVSFSAPISAFLNTAMNAYLKARRRAGCDGSVIALTFLVKQEFGIDITFEDGLCGTRRYIKQRGENLKGAVLGQWYIYGRDESTSKGYDYTVHAPGADAETRSRIYSVINIYNSAGFSFTVIE